MAQAKNTAFFMRNIKAETTGNGKLDSTIMMTEDFRIKGNTATKTIQMSVTISALYVAFQDTMNNTVILKCTNFNT